MVAAKWITRDGREPRRPVAVDVSGSREGAPIHAIDDHGIRIDRNQNPILVRTPSSETSMNQMPFHGIGSAGRPQEYRIRGEAIIRASVCVDTALSTMTNANIARANTAEKAISQRSWNCSMRCDFVFADIRRSTKRTPNKIAMTTQTAETIRLKSPGDMLAAMQESRTLIVIKTPSQKRRGRFV